MTRATPASSDPKVTQTERLTFQTPRLRGLATGAGWVLLVALFFVALLPLATVASADAATPCRALTKHQKVRVDMDAAPIADVARAVSCWLGLNLVVAPGAEAMKVQLVAPRPVSRRALLPMLRATLQTVGLRLDLSRGYGVIRSAKSPRLGLTTEQVQLRHLDADAAAQAIARLTGLTPLVATGTNTLVLVGTPAQRRLQKQWIGWLDTSGEPQKIYLVPIRHRDADDLVPLLQETLEQHRRDLRIIADTRADRLIVVARPKLWPLVRAAIARLDIEPD